MSRRTAHKLRNFLHTLLLIGGMAVIVGAAAWLILGAAGLIFAATLLAAALVAATRAPKEAVLSLFRARPLTRTQFPEARDALNALSSRAALPRAPELYLIPSSAPNAFAVGQSSDSAIAVSVGLIKLLSLRELTAVLAHEVSHIENGDLFVMGLADALTRVARVLSFAGVAMLAASVLLFALGGAPPTPVLLLPVLIFAPTVMALAQLALSRTREFDADLDGAEISGDPAALASALGKIERRTGAFWEDILLPGRRIPEPSLLRTHPPTEERIARLKALGGRVSRPPILAETAVAPAPQVVLVQLGPPRYRSTGCWY